MRFINLIACMLLSHALFAKQVSIKGELQNYAYFDSITITEFTYQEPYTETIALKDDGSFNFNFEIENTNFFQLTLNDENYLMLVLSPGEKISISADATKLKTSYTVSGSKQTELFHKASRQFDVFAQVRDSLAMAYKQQNAELDRFQADFAKEFISKNMSSLSSLLLIDKLSPEEHLDVYVSLDSALRANYPENKIVQDFHKDVSKMASQTIGFPISEIELISIEGKTVKLSSLKGKVVLIDFWATWCMPCKAEIPNIKNVYRQYKEQGFEVYSISIDKDKSRWEAEAKKLPWINVHDATNEYAQQFNVQSIPFTLLIDRQGRIAQKNVRGDALELSVKELLKK